MSGKDGLERTSPESQGIGSAALSRLLDYFAEHDLEIHSLMVLRRGRVVAEGWWYPYSADRPHSLYSLSKSFTSTAIGFAVQEGLLTVEDLVCDFFPDKLPEKVSPNLAKMRVKHLLSMSTGHEEDPTGRVMSTDDWVKAFLSLDVEQEPGTLFVYNTAGTYMLSAILHKLTGESLIDYLTPRLFEPLGIVGATWEKCPQGISTGGFGLSIKTSDIAKFGQFYLQRGVWNGKQLLNAEWIDEATKKQIYSGPNEAIEWTQGYGYQFWRCRHGAYRGDGAFGQFCVVIPEHEVVVAITAGTNDMQGVLNGLWDILLPALSPAALPENEAEHERLQARLAELALPILPGQKREGAQEFAGRYTFDSKEAGPKTASFEFGDEGCRITMEFAEGTAIIPCGYGRYEQGTYQDFPGVTPSLACACWRNENTLEILMRLVETPHAYTTICTFAPGEVELKTTVNCSFGPREFPSTVGRLEKR